MFDRYVLSIVQFMICSPPRKACMILVPGKNYSSCFAVLLDPCSWYGEIARGIY